MREHKKLVAEGSPLLPLILTFVGILVLMLVFVESYLEMTGRPFTFLDMAHNYGWLTGYKVSTQPNRGIWHLTGWIGSACFVVMMLYSIRKHFKFMLNIGSIRYWLDVHMFLGIVGTLLVTAHSTYKFGGIVALSYWSAVVVAVSGFLGRYLYVQIPRSISGQELKMDEINEIMDDITLEIEKFAKGQYDVQHYFERIAGPKLDRRHGTRDSKGMRELGMFDALWSLFTTDIRSMITMYGIWRSLKANRQIPVHVRNRVFKLIREKGRLVRSIQFLEASHKLLHYWHVFHKPFAIIMFIIMFLHIGVYYVFRI